MKEDYRIFIVTVNKPALYKTAHNTVSTEDLCYCAALSHRVHIGLVIRGKPFLLLNTGTM